MENLNFYEQLRSVPKEAQKNFDNGRFKGTDINPMWRIKKMTEVFGPCGIGWYYEVVNRSLERSADSNVISAFIGINLYIKVDGEWSKPIYGEGGNNFTTFNRKWSSIDTSDEAYKMALTDALSNATKQLGLGADIWFANDKSHSTKYDVQQENIKADMIKPKPVQEADELRREHAEQARQFLIDNAKAFEFYQRKYSHNAMPNDFSLAELETIYQQLQNANKL